MCIVSLNVAQGLGYTLIEGSFNALGCIAPLFHGQFKLTRAK